MTLLHGIWGDFIPAIFFISMAAYFPGLVFIGIDSARYYNYMENNYRDFIDDKWNDWNWGGSVRFLFSDRDLGDPELTHYKKPAKMAVFIAVFGFLPIFGGTYYLFFKVIG